MAGLYARERPRGVDFAKGVLYVNGRVVKLGPTERRIVALLWKRKGIVPRSELVVLVAAHDHKHSDEEHALNEHVSNIRRKMREGDDERGEEEAERLVTHRHPVRGYELVRDPRDPEHGTGAP